MRRANAKRQRVIQSAIETLERRTFFATGQLDPTFGAGGIVTHPNQQWLGHYTDIQIQRDGKVLALGGDLGPSNNGVVRYNRDGTLDTAFGLGGIARVGSDEHPASHEKMILQNDGKIVVVGERQFLVYNEFTQTYEGWTEPSLVRLNIDGSLDASFGEEGVAYGNFHSRMAGRNIALQPDGKFVVTGYSFDPAFMNADWFVMRFNANGSVDTSFADGGRTTLDVYGEGDYVVTPLVAADGRITAVGNAWTGHNSYDLVALRLNPDGSRDTTLDGDGMFIYRDMFTSAAAIMPDGKILLSDGGYSLLRFNTDWSLDNTFGVNGISTHMVGGQIEDMWVQSDGRILRAGHGGSGMTVSRINYDGSPDLSFGVDGGTTVAQYGDPRDEENYGRALAVAADPDGRIMLGGFLRGERVAAIICVDPGPFAVDMFGVLRLNGSDANDTITLKRDGDYLLATVNNATARVRPGGLRGIMIQARGGDDVVVVYSGVMGCYISGGDGNDRLVGGDGYDNIVGNAGKDRIDGGFGDDRLAGSGGNDAIVGSPGNDRIYGDAGNDRVEAGQGADRIWGGIGDDLLAGGSGNDMLDGQSGVNTLAGGLGVDRIYNASGFDVLYLNLPTTMTKDETTDLMTIIEVIEMT